MSPADPTAPAPATPGQVHAHRFSLRRLQNALVRREAVPGTDPLRAQSRAMIAGVVVAALGLGGFAIWGVIDRPSDWRAAGLVVGADSGAVYVVVDRTRLQPVPNLVSARLLLAADGPSGTGGTGEDAPLEVPDAVLSGVARLPPRGIPDAPALPPPDEPAPPVWSVCDTGRPDPAPAPGTSQWTRPRMWTTVSAGPDAPGAPLAVGRGLLVRDGAAGTWLVRDGARSRVDLDDRAVVLALGLVGELPRPVSTGLLNSLPEAPAITTPPFPGRGDPAPVDLGGEPVGGVVRVIGPGLPDTWYVVAADGVQVVSPVVARLVRESDPARAGLPVPTVSPNQVLGAGSSQVIPEGVYPEQAPVLVPMADASTACASARAEDERPRLSLAPAWSPPAVPLAGADGSGGGLDAVAVPGDGVVVRVVPPGRPEAPGPLSVVSGSGRASGVPDPDTAAALGLTGPEIPPAAPAPASIVGLLPPGPPLTADDARTPLPG